ncbi:PAS domain-containing sensor histidine kinase [Massilia sp. CCM 9210]|uniref:PAS domain-containing sensor histidine kinase n=1 Tax=Massilia scottii TaxID=3057166 RepID=UPI0027966D50|nr:PAS domain-containing sensor histidine kinase [Massilia sp. CCM 9210]MDQ1813341.1 PAS domain-containing sensor histidine kinase [Massilia sp. CCM 9210]
MKTWSVESLCLTVAAIVLILASVVALIALSDAHAVPRWLFSLTIALAGAALVVSLRIRALAMARNSAQSRYRHFIDTAHEGVWTLDSQSNTTFANARLAQMFGATPGTLVGRSMRDFLGDNPRRDLDEMISSDAAHVGFTHDLSYRRVDGSIGWAIVSGRPMLGDDGMAEGTLLMLTDITERKAAELELAAVQIGLEVRIRMRTAELERSNAQLRIEVAERQMAENALAESFRELRQLSSHLETIKEEERKRIAKGIHDELGQNLMALKIDVEMLHARAGLRHPLLKRKVGDVLDTIDLTIRSVRAIMNDLHPSTLELGLPAAAEWLVQQFEKRSGIATSLTVSEGEGPPPDSHRTEVIFRIIQECLLNILRHAKATHVDVGLEIGMEYLTITIVDNGVGMGPGDAAKVASFGLRGIRERVDVFGGQMVIDSRPGGGTTLAMMIPLESHETEAGLA